jgi:hypothetical protein
MGTARAGTGGLGVLALAFAAATATPVAAGDAPSAPPREALTSLEAGALARADAVVLAHVRLVAPARGGAPTLARARVERCLLGTASGEVTVFVGGPRSADRPADRPLEPWFTGTALGERGGRHVLFLRATRQGSGFTLEGLFEAEGEEGAEKTQVLAQELRLALEPDPARRRGLVVAHLLRLVEAERPWSRLHGAQELLWLAGRVRGALDETALAAIESRLARSYERPVRVALAAALDRVEPGRSARAPAARPSGPPDDPPALPPPLPPLPPEPAPPSPSGPGAVPAPPPAAPAGAASAEVARLRAALATAEGREARLEALSALARAGGASVADDLAARLADPDARVRERAAALLGDVGARGALAAVLERFPGEDDPAAREALVRAAGLLGDESTVAWVTPRGEEPGLFRAACYALARLRTPAAIERLTAWRERAAAAVPRDEATVRLLDYLRGRSFEEAERVAGHPVGPRSASRPAPPGATGGPEAAGPR